MPERDFVTRNAGFFCASAPFTERLFYVSAGSFIFFAMARKALRAASSLSSAYLRIASLEALDDNRIRLARMRTI